MEPTLEQVMLQLMELQPLLVNRSLCLSTKDGFSQVQLSVLVTLIQHGEMSLAELSRRTLISRQQLGKLVDGLYQRHFVIRRKNPQNQHSVLVCVSEEGMQNLQKRRQQFTECLKPLFLQLTSQELVIFEESIKNITALLTKLTQKENCHHESV